MVVGEQTGTIPNSEIAVREGRAPLRFDGKSDVVSHTGFRSTTGNVFVVVATAAGPVKLDILDLTMT